MDTKEKRNIVVRALMNLVSRGGKICNSSATEFLRKSVTSEMPSSEQLSNDELIGIVSETFSKMSHLSEADVLRLNEVLVQHNLFQVPSTSLVKDIPEHAHKTTCINEHLRIADLSPDDQDDNDEYDFMLDNSVPVKRIYLLNSEVCIADCTVKYSNFIFGNLIIDKNNSKYDDELLHAILSRENVVESIVNNFGFVQQSSEETCASNYKEEMFQKLYKFQPHFKTKRIDGSHISLLKVGDIIVSRSNRLDEVLEQYLIFINSRFFLSYGKINFELMEISPQYKYNVANILLGHQNINSSRYIGSLNGDKIIKSDVPFGKAVTSEIKYYKSAM